MQVNFKSCPHHTILGKLQKAIEVINAASILLLRSQSLPTPPKPFQTLSTVLTLNLSQSRAQFPVRLEQPPDQHFSKPGYDVEQDQGWWRISILVAPTARCGLRGGSNNSWGMKEVRSLAQEFISWVWEVEAGTWVGADLWQEPAGAGSVYRWHIQDVRGNSLVVQWLGRGDSTAGGMGSIPGQGTRIPASQVGWQKKKERKKRKNGMLRNILCHMDSSFPQIPGICLFCLFVCFFVCVGSLLLHAGFLQLL